MGRRQAKCGRKPIPDHLDQRISFSISAEVYKALRVETAREDFRSMSECLDHVLRKALNVEQVVQVTSV